MITSLVSFLKMPNRSTTRKNQQPESRTSNGLPINYLEKSIKETELNSENYYSWKVNMLYLLDINNLIDYVISEKINKIKINSITNMGNYVIDKLDNTLVYDKNISPTDIKNDNITKYIIMNSIGKNSRRIIESRSRTVYQSWKILESSFTKSKEQLKSELKLRLEKFKYDPKLDINIFVASMENIIEELEQIDNPINDNIKVGILNRSLPEQLRFINIFQFRDNWKDCKKYVLKVIPDIIYSNTKENSIINKENRNFEISDSIIKRKHNKYYNKIASKKNGRCYTCKTYGHYANKCPLNKKFKYNKKFTSNRKFKNHNKNIKNRYNQYKYQNNYKNNQSLYAKTNKISNQNYKEKYLETFTVDYNTDTKNEVNIVENSINNNNENNYTNKNNITV